MSLESPPGWREFQMKVQVLHREHHISAYGYTQLMKLGKELAMEAWETGADDMLAAAEDDLMRHNPCGGDL